MTAAQRRPTRRSTESSATSEDERRAIILGAFRLDLVHWISYNPRVAIRVMRLIDEILKDPFSGTGKPEPLKHEYAGDWSRRITDEDRVVYTVTRVGVFFSRARGHYGRR